MLHNNGLIGKTNSCKHTPEVASITVLYNLHHGEYSSSFQLLPPSFFYTSKHTDLESDRCRMADMRS